MTRAALLLVLAAGHASASPPDIYGFGARALGLAGAMTAAVDDGAANFYNPAALTRRGAIAFDTGWLMTATSLRLNGNDVGVDEGSGLQVGVVVPGEIGPVRLAFGLGLHLPQDRVSRVRALPQYQPRFSYYDNRPQRLFLSTNLAIRPLPWLHIGGGVAFLAETAGVLDLRGLIHVPDAEASTLSTEVDVAFETVRYPIVGILVAPSERWSVGVSYREEVKVVLDVGTIVAGALVIGGTELPGRFDLRSFSTNLFTPRQLWFGGTFRPIPALLVTADVGWLDWSAYPAEASKVTIALDIEGFPTDGLIPPPVEVVPPGFHDVAGVRVGVEGSLALGGRVTLDLRGGYAWEGAPSPEQPGETNYVDMAKHTIGLGAGITIARWNPWVAEPISIDLAAQAVLLERRDIRKEDPADLIGDYEASGDLFTFSGTVRWRF